MTHLNPQAWLDEPTVHGVFMRFPLPIAMLGGTGSVKLANERFTSQFDVAILKSPALRDVACRPDGSWQSVRLPARNGITVDARAQALPVQDGVMLLVDEGVAPQSDRQLQSMRATIAALERQTASDHLTGAWNRAHLDRSIAAEIARSGSLRQPVSLLLLDIDHFKSVNDAHGHQAGDSVLREMVALVSTRVRKADAMFRWGGEEFVVLASATGYRNAATLAENVRRAVEEHHFDIAGRLTVSIGVAEHNAAESAEAWFRRLDAALYRAKHGGRNRVVTDRLGDSDVWAAQSGSSALSLVWQEAYECGQAVIDRQHRELFDLANGLIAASFVKDQSPEAFQDALDGLLAHLAGHFRDEEALLAAHHYERLAPHKAAHAHLLCRAGELRADAQAGRITLGALVAFLANDVVARHILTADRDFHPLFGAS